MRTTNIKKSIYLNAFVTYNKKIYACSMESNGLFELDEDNNANLICLFPLEEPYKRFLIADSILIGDKIVFVPDSANHIYIYDISANEISFVDFKTDVSSEGYDLMFKFSRIVEYKNWLYILPATYPYILKMDKETLKIEYLPVNINRNKYWFRKQYCMKNGSLFMVSINSPHLLCLEFDTDTITGFRFSDEDDGGMSAVFYDNDIWIPSSTKEKLYRVNLSLKENTEYVPKIGSYFIKEKQRPFSMGFIKNDKIVLAPMGGNIILSFDINEKVFEKMEIENLMDGKLFLACQFQDDKCAVFYRRTANMWEGDRQQVFFDTQNLQVFNVCFCIKDIYEYKKALIKQAEKFELSISESDLFDLSDILSLVGNGQIKKNEKMSNIGERIFNHIQNS